MQGSCSEVVLVCRVHAVRWSLCAGFMQCGGPCVQGSCSEMVFVCRVHVVRWSLCTGFMQ